MIVVLTSLILLITLQCICVWKHQLVRLKYIQFLCRWYLSKTKYIKEEVKQKFSRCAVCLCTSLSCIDHRLCYVRMTWMHMCISPLMISSWRGGPLFHWSRFSYSKQQVLNACWINIQLNSLWRQRLGWKWPKKHTDIREGKSSSKI